MFRALILLSATCVAGCYASHERGPEDSGAEDAFARPVDANPDTAPRHECGTSTCGIDELCMRGRCAGCCTLPPSCVQIPPSCLAAPTCGCFESDPCGGCTTCQTIINGGLLCGNCTCTCAAPWTPIATPSGPRRIADLRTGDLVYTVDHGEVRARPIERVNRSAVTRHAMVRVTLASGERIEMSGGHPSADGRRFDSLAPGDHLGVARIVSVETVRYDEPFTYDILPAGDTGTYFAYGAWIGSTLHVAATSTASVK